jgi:hypothetical protein
MIPIFTGVHFIEEPQNLLLAYQSNRIIVRIAVGRLAAHGIETYRVSYYVPPKLITKPEDDEVILVRPGKKYFPKAIIVEFFELAD